MKKIDKRYIWIGLGVLTLLMRWLLGFMPTFVENVYSRGLYTGVRWLFDYTVTRLPFPLFYVLAFILLVWMVWAIIKVIKRKRSWKKRLGNGLLSIGAFAGGAVFLFMWLWGFNYARVPLESQLNFQPEPLSYEEVEAAFIKNTALLDSLRQNIPNTDTNALSAAYLPDKLEHKMRDLLVEVLEELDYTAPGRVRGRLIYPKGIMRRTGSSGIYIPFIGEGNIDGSLHHLSMPFTIAHEMAHGYGHGDEGTCNFLAYLACQRSTDPYIRYAGQYSYWRYLRSALRGLDYEAYQALETEFPVGIHNDLESLKKSWAEYQTWFPDFHDWLYDGYLKSQGVSEGLQSYSRVVMMVEAWEE